MLVFLFYAISSSFFFPSFTLSCSHMHDFQRMLLICSLNIISSIYASYLKINPEFLPKSVIPLYKLLTPYLILSNLISTLKTKGYHWRSNEEYETQWVLACLYKQGSDVVNLLVFYIYWIVEERGLWKLTNDLFRWVTGQSKPCCLWKNLHCSPQGLLGTICHTSRKHKNKMTIEFKNMIDWLAIDLSISFLMLRSHEKGN